MGLRLRVLVASCVVGVPLACASLSRRAESDVELLPVSTPDSSESFGSLTPDGSEFYYTIHRPNFSRHRIVVSRALTRGWSAPSTMPFSGQYNDREPKLSPDGRRLFFSSNRPTGGGDTLIRRDLDIWFVERGSDGEWSSPRHLPAPVNSTAQEFSPVVARSGNLYFIANRGSGLGRDGHRHNVWLARALDASGERYAEPENLGPAINSGVETNVYVTPDERLMLVSRDSAPEGLGGDDLFVSRRVGADWTQMRHLAAPISSREYDYGPLISPDGRWLLFTSWRRGTSDIYRVPASWINR